ncbi:MAG TPA: carboxypeptidase regulatory-like domain-containing protein [Pyrinomonadaceae bacterium]|nr:carboxypeptidase regulatory-like domain-containing protein [Pyrinomonadaceae bacterium]
MRLVQISLLILIAGLAIIGQTNRGGISGTVTDSNGAVVPMAKVTIKNVGTNQSTTVVTSSSGSFSVTSLEPVEYDVMAEAANFKKAVIQKIKVDTATVQTVNVVLEVGNFSETVNIEAEDALINTESGTTSKTISEVQLRELPLNNRSVLDLAVTVANVSGDAGSEDAEVTSGQPVPGFNLSLNGGRPGGTSILADGVNNTGVGIGRAVVSFTPETVQEFTVQTSAYSAEYGNTSGGVINATTKSGTNRFNGTALFYHRNPATNAKPYRIGTTPRTPNNLKYSQGSLTVGGPVYLPAFGEGGPKLYDGHDRTFFFFAYEPRWRQDFVTVTTLLRSQAERNGDFRNLTRTSGGWVPTAIANQFNVASTGPSNIYQQFTLGANGTLIPITLGTGFQYCQFGDPRATLNAAGQPQCSTATNATPNPALNVLPAAFIDPKAPRILEYMPLGGDYFLDGGLIRNYVVNRQVTQNETRYTLKLDHQLTRSNKLGFRYSVTPAIAVRNFGTDVNGSTGVFSDAKQFLLTDDHIFSPSVVNNLRLSYTKGVFSEDFSPEFSINGGRNLATELGLPSLTSGGLPLFQLSSDSGTNSAFADVGSSGSTNNFNKEERYNVDEIVYWNRGNQSWKFGINMGLAKLNVIPFFGASGGRWEFRVLNTSNNRSTTAANGGDPLASLLLGVPNAVQVRPLLLDYNYYWKNGAAFVQNDWKVRPNLTVNLGLRYSLQTPRGERNNQQGAFRPDLAQSVTLTDAQRTAIITGLGITATSPNYAAIVAQIPTTVQIPVFALAGYNGRSKYLTDVAKRNFEPRFGFAWSPKFWEFLSKRSAAVRGGYGISHAPLTGNNRLPNPDFGGFQAVSTLATGSTVGGTANPSQPVRLSGNAPLVGGGSFQQALVNQFAFDPATGIIGLNSLGVPGFAVVQDGSEKVPYTQNWNLTVSFEIMKNTSVEFAYVGNRGVHLYMPNVNINPRSTSFVELLEGSNVAAENAFADPLGRRNALGAVLAIQRNSINSTYFGFNTLNQYFNPSATSIYHGAYVEVRRRFSGGLSFSSNYTFGKSIDDASDSSPDVRVLTSGTTLGQSYYGAPRSGDRAVSAFDLRHNFNNTFVWDLPFGARRAFFNKLPGAVDAIVGGWSMSGIFRLQGGQPFTPFITDTNRLGGVNRSVRMNIVPGVSLKNPLYDKSCSVGGGCEPWVNPAAFTRPDKGSLGNSGRTLNIRGPIQQYFDLSLQKTFTLGFLGGEGRRKLNFRVDLLNALNHPVFRLNNTGNTPFGFGTLPVETPVTLAEYNNWAAFNGLPAATGATDPNLLAVQNLTISNRLPSGAIPLNFYSIPVPEGFATRNPNSFDIRTLTGLKHYRLRGTYDANFGTLFAVNNPRYVQFGLRLFF